MEYETIGEEVATEVRKQVMQQEAENALRRQAQADVLLKVGPPPGQPPEGFEANHKEATKHADALAGALDLDDAARKGVEKTFLTDWIGGVERDHASYSAQLEVLRLRDADETQVKNMRDQIEYTERVHAEIKKRITAATRKRGPR